MHSTLIKNNLKTMKKNVIKLNENTLRQIVAESVRRALKEYDEVGDENVPTEPKKRRNVKRIRITGLGGACLGRHKDWYMDQHLMLRYARNVGDEESVNHYVLGVLRRHPYEIQFEIIG